MRRLSFEKLETRRLFAVTDWQNTSNPLDVDQSGSIVPLDVLLVINQLNRGGSHTLSDPRPDALLPYVDVNGNGTVEPLDALLVINALNALPKVGASARSVKLPNQDGEEVDFGNYLGKQPVVLYFYPRDNTPACSIEASDFRDRADEIAELGAKVFGVSVDGVASHQSFSRDLNLNFDILADSTSEVASKFGVLSQIGDIPIARRTTFVIGTDGLIKNVFTDVDVSVHGDEVIDALKAMNATA